MTKGNFQNQNSKIKNGGKNKLTKKKNPKLRIASNMPPLYHTLPGEKYNHKKSEVLKWLSERPALIEHLFTVVSNTKDIIYDPATGKWQGVNWEDDE